jgi:hypothetical protein
MRFFILGIAAGAVASLFFLSPTAGVEIYPEWHAAIKAIGGIERSGNRYPDELRFFVKGDQDYYLLKGNGELAASGRVVDGLTAFSGNGLYYIKYQKVGSDLEFFNSRGERFWKLESLEYPYLSYNGRLVFLLNGDQTSVRFVDNNGNEIGDTMVSGRTGTALSFSDHGDFGGIGFLDGSYYIVNAKGWAVHRGVSPKGNMVKGIAVSGNGRYASVHHGNNKKDFVRIIDIHSGDYDDVELGHIHPVKTSLHVTDAGFCAVIDIDRILRISPSGGVKYAIAIPKKRHGHSSLSYRSGVYAASYTMQNASSRLVILREDGTVILSKEFPAESFLDAVIRDDLVFLRGSNSLFCYSIHRLQQ